ncbi:hypothetical protein ACIBEJ_34065 [Nonomuraea sp. NPDC050790]|uniref:hypothetical protein n=1 Tax=Nonomuraea sp. NPDC050790 TaxID=3364371 RepID=UPI00379D1339
MINHPQHPTTPKPAPDPGPDFSTAPAPGSAPGEALSVEAVIEQARTMRQRNINDLARRLGRGEQLSGEQLRDTLRDQTLATWWLLVERHIRHAGGGLTPEQSMAKFASWISTYLKDDAVEPVPDIALYVGLLGEDLEHEFVLHHVNRAMTLIRRDAARTFLRQVRSLAPASAEQTPSGTSTGAEGTA